MHKLKELQTRLPQVWLRPGEIYIARHPTLISTILGSCVTICLFHTDHLPSAMCHCLLPSGKTGKKNDDFRYVDTTLPYLIENLIKLGIPLRGMLAKLFGGAIISRKTDRTSPSAFGIGRANVEMARKLLEARDIPLVAECVGGHKGYKLYFDSGTGDVFLSRL